MSNFKSSRHKSEISLYENFIRARKIRIKHTKIKKLYVEIYLFFKLKKNPKIEDRFDGQESSNIISLQEKKIILIYN